MAKDQLGVGAVKSLALLVVSFIVQAVQSFKDGFQPSDLSDFVDEGMKAATSAGVFKNVGPEIKDGLSLEQATELKDAIKKAFVEAELGVEGEEFIDDLATDVLDACIANLKIYYRVKERREQQPA